MLREGFIKGYFAGLALAIGIMITVDKIPINNTLIGLFIGSTITIVIIALMNVVEEEDYICLTREELNHILDDKLMSQEEVDSLIEKLKGE